MASYVSPNYNPAYYDVPTFEAPLDLAFRVSQQKQAQFDSGLNQVKQAYQANLNLPVESQIGIEKRDAFMKEANQKLRKMVSANFSLSENVAAANRIYEPLTEDKDIQMDLYKGSLYRKGLSELEGYKNRKLDANEKYIDPYYSERFLREGYDAFRSAKSSNELASAESRQFVRPVDFIGEWNNVAKDLKITGDGAQVYMTPAGIYMYKEKNGRRAVPGLLNLANSQLSPEARNYINVIGKVSFNDEVKRIASTHYGGDQNLATEHISKQMMTTAKGNFTDLYNEADAILSEKQKDLEALKKRGLTLPEIDEQYKAVYKRLEGEIEDIKKQKDYLQNKKDELDPTSAYGKAMSVSGKSRYEESLDTYLKSPDQYFSSNLINSYTKAWAEGLAKSTYQFTVEENKGYIASKNAETELIKAQADLAKSINSSTQKSTTDSNSPVPSTSQYGGPDPYTQNIQDKYDRWVSTIKTTTSKYISGNLKLAEGILPRIAGGASLLEKLQKKIIDGEGSNGISGSDPLTEQEKNALTEFEKLGVKVKDEVYNYENVYNAIKDYTLSKAKEKVNSSDPNAVEILAQSNDLKDQEAVINKLNDDKKRVDGVLLAKKEFEPLRNRKGDIMSKEEYIKSKFIKTQENPDYSGLGLGQVPLNSNKKQKMISGTVEEREKELGKQYEELKTKFNTAFSDTIRNSKEKYNFLETNGNDVRIGLQYPIATFGFDDKERTNSENIVTEMFNEGTIARDENYSPVNLQALGMDVKTLKPILAIFRNNASELKAEDGNIDVVAVGADNRRPEYRFRPSSSFIKKLSEDDRKAIGEDNLQRIMANGISINNNVLSSDFEKNLISEVSLYKPLLDRAGGVMDLDDFIEDKGFGVTVSKNMDGTYRFDINTLKPDGSPNDVYTKSFDIQKLDAAIKEARRGLYTAYITYKKANSTNVNNVRTEAQLNKEIGK